jgi:hypothetical protein
MESQTLGVSMITEKIAFLAKMSADSVAFVRIYSEKNLRNGIKRHLTRNKHAIVFHMTV